MSVQDYKLYHFIESHVRDENQQTKMAGDIVTIHDRRSGQDRRKKGKYVKAEINIKTDGAEINATGGTVTATKNKDGESIQAVGAVIKKK